MDWNKIEYYEVTALAKTELARYPEQGRHLTRITFYGEDRCMGVARFYPPECDTPDCAIEFIDGNPNRPMITLAYPLLMLPTVLNLLQNEKPVWIYFANQTNCGLTTGKEAVGEQEGGSFAAAERRRRR